jgi:regulator of nucleoside diphosphate kinase
MSALFTSTTMPVLFAVSGERAIPGLPGGVGVPNDATGIVVIGVRRFERRGPAATLGAHILSPWFVSALPLEERVLDVLRAHEVDVPAVHRVPATLSLPAGLGGAVPIVGLTLNLILGTDRLAQVGEALRPLRAEGVLLVGVAQEGAPGGEDEMLATVAVVLGAAQKDDRVTDLGTRRGGHGFVLLPASHDAVDDDACCFWSFEAAGEMPLEVVEQLRPYLLSEEAGENHGMKKKDSSIRITRFDKERLTRLLRSLDAAAGNRDEIEDLERELERGAEVESTEVPPDVVTMNSTVRVTDLDANTTHLYTIVFPGDADFERGRISILSPLGTALLGCSAGDVVTWDVPPRGTRRLRIDELVYQPEAAGDFHL